MIVGLQQLCRPGIADDLRDLMADEIGGRYVQAIGPHRGAAEDAAIAFAALCDRAAAHDLLVGIEWLPYTNIATPADAKVIVEGADRPNGVVQQRAPWVPGTNMLMSAHEPSAAPLATVTSPEVVSPRNPTTSVNPALIDVVTQPR